ncbi:MAG: hypothetical protein ACMXYG_01175 [Candidatus Woesearchaeota archaeon]
MYVFGFDIPLPELLAIAFLVMLISLIMIYLKIIKLSKLIKMEKLDVNHLDKDVVLLDNFIDRNPSDALVNFVADKLERGTPKEKIKKSLLNAGFKLNVINDVFKKVDE